MLKINLPLLLQAHTQEILHSQMYPNPTCASDMQSMVVLLRPQRMCAQFIDGFSLTKGHTRHWPWFTLSGKRVMSSSALTGVTF